MAILTLIRASVGRKQLLSVCGVLMMGWSLLHVLGNFTVFAGPTTFNAYARALHDSPVLWLQRIAFWSLLVVHIGLVLGTVRAARRARPVAYGHAPKRSHAVTSRWVRGLSSVFFVLLVAHVAHIYGVGHVDYAASDPHHNLVAGVRAPWVGAGYLALAWWLAWHLFHGVRAALTTWGAPPWLARRLRPVRHLPWLLGAGFTAVLLRCWWGP